MAKIGLKYFRYGKLDETTASAPKYGKAETPGKAISASVSISNNSVTLYADDALAESDTSFQSGTITLGIDRDDLKTQADLLGHTYSEENGIVRNATDVAPYVGVGRVITMIVGNVKSYKVEFLNKVKFSEPSQTDNTRGENVSFATVEIAGTISTLASGSWSDAKVFATESEAITYLDGKFGKQ